MENKTKEDEVSREIKKWEKTGEVPSPEILANLISNQNEVSNSNFIIIRVDRQ